MASVSKADIFKQVMKKEGGLNIDTNGGEVLFGLNSKGAGASFWNTYRQAIYKICGGANKVKGFYRADLFLADTAIYNGAMQAYESIWGTSQADLFNDVGMKGQILDAAFHGRYHRNACINGVTGSYNTKEPTNITQTAATANSNPAKYLSMMIEMRKMYINRLYADPKNKVYRDGWLKRVDEMAMLTSNGTYVASPSLQGTPGTVTNISEVQDFVPAGSNWFLEQLAKRSLGKITTDY